MHKFRDKLSSLNALTPSVLCNQLQHASANLVLHFVADIVPCKIQSDLPQRSVHFSQNVSALKVAECISVSLHLGAKPQPEGLDPLQKVSVSLLLHGLDRCKHLSDGQLHFGESSLSQQLLVAHLAEPLHVSLGLGSPALTVPVEQG